MVGALLAHLDLPELYAGVSGGAAEHGDKQLLRGEVTARAGGQIAAAGQQLHGAVVDLLIAGHGLGNSSAAFGKGRRIENNKIIAALLLFQLPLQV